MLHLPLLSSPLSLPRHRHHHDRHRRHYRHHQLNKPVPFLSLLSNPTEQKATRGADFRPLIANLPESPIPPPPPPPQPMPAAGADEGPIELPSSKPSPIFAVDDNPSALQVATSVLLTGAISVFLFRSLRRRAKRAKELRVRSTGVKKTTDLRAEALDSLKAIAGGSVEAGAPPSPAQALLGGIAAGVIAVILYKFTITIEAGLNRQTISENFSVRQITVTVRTIINGLCYLATFVFGVNSVGLILYSVQLGISSFMESFSITSSSSKKEDMQLNAMSPAPPSPETVEPRSEDGTGDT